MTPSPLARHIVLIGLPGAGKSTVGRRVAEHLGRLFIDFDVEIERSSEMSIPEIFASLGEPHFRAAEVQVSQRLASPETPDAVLAPGGGWAANAAAVAHLRAASRIIYLRVTPSEAIRRIGKGIERRPLFAGEPALEVMKRLWDERRHIYEGVADLTVETDGLSSEDVAMQVVALSAAAFHRYIKI